MRETLESRNLQSRKGINYIWSLPEPQEINLKHDKNPKTRNPKSGIYCERKRSKQHSIVVVVVHPDIHYTTNESVKKHRVIEN